MSESAESLIVYCRENDRVCPQPQLWNELWEMLPARQRVGNGWEPSLPLILGGWHHSSNLDKMVRFAEHIKWAEEHGKLKEVSDFLRALKETDWHHLSD